jgi:hypothetical protein
MPSGVYKHERSWEDSGLRPPKQQLRHSLRMAGLNSNDLEEIDAKREQLRELKKMKEDCITNGMSADIHARLDALIVRAAEEFITLVTFVEPFVAGPTRRNPTELISIDYFYQRPEQSLGMTGYKHTDLIRVIRALNLDRNITLANGTVMFGHFVCLFGLYKFTTGICTTVASYNSIIGHDNTQLSRAFSWLNKYMFFKYGAKLTDNLKYWVKSFPYFAERIEKVLREKYGVRYRSGEKNEYFGMVDCHILESQRPGGPEGNGYRLPNWLQRAFYQG